MSTNVIMPQMGESVAEGTITKWLKKAGERVDRDEPLFEISTDKVDAEIPSPAAGILAQVLVKENETVAVNTIVAVIDDGSAAVAAPVPETKEEIAPPSVPEAAVPPASARSGFPGFSKRCQVITARQAYRTRPERRAFRNTRHRLGRSNQ